VLRAATYDANEVIGRLIILIITCVRVQVLPVDQPLPQVVHRASWWVCFEESTATTNYYDHLLHTDKST
jgi:hypothetical protein